MSIVFTRDKQNRIVLVQIDPEDSWEEKVASDMERLGAANQGSSFGDARRQKPFPVNIAESPEWQKYLSDLEAAYKKKTQARR